MKKLFGGINLTWKKLILFAIATGIYTAIMLLLPITEDTSFRDIGVYFEWWILFGIIIIANSKSPKDSALKCFVFFLISQPLIYLIQVPFNDLGFKIFMYYKYWFIWTILTIPMGFIGYYIKKKNIISMIILLPMLILLAYLGIGYFSSAVSNFPHHLLSFISCFLIIIAVVFCIFDKTKLRVITLSIVFSLSLVYIVLMGGIINREYETYRNLDDLDYNFSGKLYVSFYSGTAKGFVKVADTSSEYHTVILNGRKNGKYTFTLNDEEENEYSFEYYYDEEEQTIILNPIKLEDNNE